MSEPPRSPQDRVENIIRSAVNLTDWERDFLHNIAGWSRLSPKQERKLAMLEARAKGELPDAKTAFLDAMEAAGVVPVDSIAHLLGPDKIRFRCKCDRSRKNGWARFYDDGLPAGSFGHYKLQIAKNWRMEDARVLTSTELAEAQRQQQQAKDRREAEQRKRWEAAAYHCNAMWGCARRQPDADHAYLLRKGIRGEGLRQIEDMLLVPMHDADGRLWNLQRIWPSGKKLYLKGARASGLFTVIGQPRDRLVIAEGYATAAVIRRATGWPIVVAFCWKNLIHTANIMRSRLPDADIVIAADDDAHLVDNPHVRRNLGLEAAQQAAQAIGGRLAVPTRRAA